MKLYVVAGNVQQFHDCLRDLRTNPQAAEFVREPDALQGVELIPGQVVYYGSYRERDDWPAIMRRIVERTQRAA